MTIVDARCYRYNLPMQSPLSVGKQTITDRQGVLLRVENGEGAVGWGDAAPLPGFSSESVAGAVDALSQQAKSLPGREVPDTQLGELLQTCSSVEKPPSVQFAVESALVELAAQTFSSRSVESVLGGGRSSVSINAVLTAETSDLESEVRRLRESGFQTVKVKVGRASIEEDVERVRTAHQVLGAGGRIRLDANRAWTFEQAVSFVEGLEEVSPEYIEEPLRDPSRLGEFVGTTGASVALDETTREWAPGAVPEKWGIAAVVLKPTLLGGIATARRWVQWARSIDAQPVISASYESGVGHRMLVALASVLSPAPAGLSTYIQLAEDVLSPRLVLDGPRVNVAQAFDGAVDPSALISVEPR